VGLKRGERDEVYFENVGLRGTSGVYERLYSLEKVLGAHT